MTKTKDGGEDVGDFLDKLIPSLTICSRMWGTSLGYEPDRFLDGQGGDTGGKNAFIQGLHGDYIVIF